MKSIKKSVIFPSLSVFLFLLSFFAGLFIPKINFQVKADSDSCDPDHKVFICHDNNGSKDYVKNCVDKDSIIRKEKGKCEVNGHGKDGNDIIPSFSDNGCSFDGLNTDKTDWIGNGCKEPAKPKCSSNSDCNDNNSCTSDICKNPGKSDAYCENTNNPVNGEWSYSGWGVCSGSCGGGIGTETRTAKDCTASCGGSCGTAVTSQRCTNNTECSCTDTDEDGVCDSIDNCVNNSNSDQANNDGDAFGNVCDSCSNVYTEDNEVPYTHYQSDGNYCSAKTPVCRDEEAINYHSEFNDEREYSDNESCKYNNDEPTPTPTPTATPNGDICANLDGIQLTMPEDYHHDNDKVNCLKFELGGPPPPPAVDSGIGGANVLGVSTKSGEGMVLGATTMAGTGVVEDSLFYSMFTLGSLLTSFGIMKNGKKKA